MPTDIAMTKKFLDGLSASDLLDRFGSPARASTTWLLDRLQADPHQQALVASGGSTPIALLDFVNHGDRLELGIVVEAAHRGRGVASRLLATLAGHHQTAGFTATCSPSKAKGFHPWELTSN